MTSGLSHLDADMHEVENSSSRASRLIHEPGSDLEKILARKDELVAALDATAKPYFGDLDDMTYAQWATRIVELLPLRGLDLGRPRPRPLPPDRSALVARRPRRDPDPLPRRRLHRRRPLRARPPPRRPPGRRLHPRRPRRRRMVPRTVPQAPQADAFVPVLDTELARWWGTDTLWQAQDPRFAADAVRIIPWPALRRRHRPRR